MTTFSPKPKDIAATHRWWEVDADGLTLGRLATEVASRLKGKHKAIFAPHVDTGDHVIIVNADKVYMHPRRAEQKLFQRYSGYPGGLKSINYRDRLAVKPQEVVRDAVRGMLPKNTVGRQMLGKLKVYTGPSHPHEAQKPQKLDLPTARRASA